MSTPAPHKRRKYTPPKARLPNPICEKDQAHLCFLVEWLQLYYDSRFTFLRNVTYALRFLTLASFLLLWVFVPHHENVVALCLIVTFGLLSSYCAQRSYSGMEECRHYCMRLSSIDAYALNTHQKHQLSYYESKAKYRSLVAHSKDETMWFFCEPSIPYNGIKGARLLFRHLLP